MFGEFGGLQIAGGTTAVQVPTGGLAWTQDWAAIAAGKHGNLAVVETAATGKLTLKPGTYLVRANLSIESEEESSASTQSNSYSSVSSVSSKSSSSPLNNVDALVAQIFRGGSPLAGTKGAVSALFHDRPAVLQCAGIVEITDTHVSAGENYVQVYLFGNEYVTVREAQFFAVKLN